MKKITQRLAFIGAGNMAEALARGLLQKNVCQKEQLLAADVAADRCAHFQQTYGIQTAADNFSAATWADIILLAVKPQNMPAVLAQLKPVIKQNQLVISIAAGITLARLENALGPSVRIVRAMPNLPAVVGAGATVFCRNAQAGEPDRATANAIFSAVGLVLEMAEQHLNAVTALSGSGPAYIFYLAEALIEGGVKLGLPVEAAGQLAQATISGAARLLEQPGAVPEDLRAKVTSRGGTTAAALEKLQARDFKNIMHEALAAACQRAAELAQ